MEIWLKNDDYNLRFPVLPSSYEISSESGNTTEVVDAYGEVNLLGKRMLKNIEFETFFPKVYDPTYCCIRPQFAPPGHLEAFESMKQSGVCTLTMTGMVFSGKVTIESLTGHEDDGTGDMYISFSFKEYRLPKVKKRVAKKAKAGTYTTRKGDTLSKIAKKKTGKSSNWKTIYKDNKKKLKKAGITTGGKKMKAGIKLKIRAF